MSPKLLFLALATSLAGACGLAGAADAPPDASTAGRQERMDQALSDARAHENSSGTLSQDAHSAGQTIKADAHKTGQAISHGAHEAGHAVSHAASEAGTAIGHEAHKASAAMHHHSAASGAGS
jgi:hypothetical protein